MDRQGAADPRVESVMRLLDAYSRRDVAAMQREMALEVTLEAVGNNPLAGTYVGVGSVLAFIAKTMATFVPGSVSVETVAGDGDEVRVVVAGRVALVDETTAPVRILQRYRFGEDGLVAGIRAESADDPESFDQLLARRARRG